MQKVKLRGFTPQAILSTVYDGGVLNPQKIKIKFDELRRQNPETTTLGFEKGQLIKRLQRSTVFCNNIATVMGPTPPGTGVINSATSATESN